jgi:hypothetical protein
VLLCAARPLRARLLRSCSHCSHQHAALQLQPLHERRSVSAHKPHGCPVSERKREGQQIQVPANHPIQGCRYSSVSTLLYPGTLPSASAVISTRLPVRHVFPSCTPLQLVFTLCKIDLRPRRPRTWCHLSLAASCDDHDQAYFPIGFTQVHVCACCAWLHEYCQDVVTTAFDCLHRARIGRTGGTRTTLKLREDDTTTKSNRPSISPHCFKTCSHDLDVLSIHRRRHPRQDGFRRRA